MYEIGVYIKHDAVDRLATVEDRCRLKAVPKNTFPEEAPLRRTTKNKKMYKQTRNEHNFVLGGTKQFFYRNRLTGQNIKTNSFVSSI